MSHFGGPIGQWKESDDIVLTGKILGGFDKIFNSLSYVPPAMLMTLTLKFSRSAC